MFYIVNIVISFLIGAKLYLKIFVLANSFFSLRAGAANDLGNCLPQKHAHLGCPSMSHPRSSNTRAGHLYMSIVERVTEVKEMCHSFCTAMLPV